MLNSGLNETAKATPAAEPRVPVEIRELDYPDLPPVVAIERRSFPSPWSLGMFVLEMAKPETIGLVATERDRLTGYLVLSRFDRAWHLMNIAVAPEQRRRGIASMLTEAALGRIGEHEPVTLEVRPTNRSAIALYEGSGFVAFGLRKGYYPDNGEDALIMWKGDPALAGVPAEELDN